MKILLGLMAFFMLPSVTGLGSEIGNAITAKNNTQDNVAFSPEAYHESNYYSIDLVADSSLSYPSNDVRLICRTTGYSHGVEFSVGGYYYLTSFHVLDDGTSYELRLTPRYSFENVGTTITATQYDSRSGQDIIRSEAFYSVWREDYISLSTTSMEHAHDCADLAYFKRISSNQSLARDFFTEWDQKNNNRTNSFVSSVLSGGGQINKYRFYLSDENGLQPLRHVNVGVFTTHSGETADWVYITDGNGEIVFDRTFAPVTFLRLMSCSIDNYYMSTDWEPARYPSGIALNRNKDDTSSLGYYYYDFPVVSDYAMEFFVDTTNSSGQTSSFAKAMKVIQTLAYGKEYAEEMSGEQMAPGEVYHAYYPCSGKRSSYKPVGYLGTKNNMYISEDAYGYPDVMLHELGHCFQNKYNFGDSLNIPHYIGIDNATLLSNGLDALKLAWGEAWPTVYANLVCQRYSSYIRGQTGPLFTSFDSHDCSFNLETPTVNYGHQSEEDVAAALYDLYDAESSAESFDRLSYGHQDLWNLMVGASRANNGIKTFGDFLNYYQNTHSQNDNENLQRIVRQYGFSPSATTNGNGTISSAPMITWSSVNGANKYEVVLYDGYGTRITTRVSYLTYYGIDDYDWNAILLSPTSNWYYEIIAYTEVNGVSYGGYSSGRVCMSKPTGIVDGGILVLSNSSSSRIIRKDINLPTNQTIKYTFRATNAGYTTFQTVGPYGSVIKLYDSNNNLVASDVGGMYGEGYGPSRQRNGFFRYYCSANKTYTLTVKDCNDGRNYYGTLLIMQAHAYTIGSSNYTTAYSLNELVTNDGSLYIECFKKKTSVFNYVPSSGIGTFTAQLSSDLDTYLYVVDALNGVVYEDDDSAGNYDAKVTFQASSGNRYLIMVTQYNPANDPSSNSGVQVHIWKN